jgi:nucleoside-diphosphate-sugar epimerase
VRLFVFGLGYSARVFARTIKDNAESIVGTVRSREEAAALARADGIEVISFDGRGASAEVIRALPRTTHLLVSVPPGEAGDPVLNDHAADIAATVSLRSIVYLSTIGVYGDQGGAWVDEDTPARPTSARSIARLAAENAWTRLAAGAGKPLAILRLAGIYGPGRNAMADLRAGTARRILKPNQVFNRIHVEDVATAISAAFERSANGVFNVADDEPASPQDVVAYAADLMGVPSPPLVPVEEANLTPMARSFYAENKRARNAKMKEALGVALRYPTFREGLATLKGNPG